MQNINLTGGLMVCESFLCMCGCVKTYTHAYTFSNGSVFMSSCKKNAVFSIKLKTNLCQNCLDLFSVSKT